MLRQLQMYSCVAKAESHVQVHDAQLFPQRQAEELSLDNQLLQSQL